MRIIQKAIPEDLDRLMAIYAYARQFMKENGNPNQWGDHRPARESVWKEIQEERLYKVMDGDFVAGVFSFFAGHDVTYDLIKEGEWLNDEPYGVIHKIASAEGGKGILQTALEFAEPQVPNLRIDTHQDNRVMRHLLEKYGYTYCGIIYTDDGTERLAFQKVLRK